MIPNGVQAERLVAQAYRDKGFTIIDTNYTYLSHGKKQGEIDIIACKQKHLHIIEVKYRSSGHEYALDHIQQFQLQKILRTYKSYILTHTEYESYTAQVDIALVDPTSVEIIPNIDL